MTSATVAASLKTGMTTDRHGSISALLATMVKVL
jgi:hypothetical protein